MPEQKWEPVFRFETVVSLVLAAVTIGGLILGWAQEVPWIVRIPAILLTLCAMSWLWDRHGEKISKMFGFPYRPLRPSAPHGELEIAAGKDASANAFVLTRRRRRQLSWGVETEEGPRGKFYVLKCSIGNNTTKTILDVGIFLNCRSWQGLTLPIYKDVERRLIFDDGPLVLHPGQNFEFAYLSQSVDDPGVLYLGDHNDNEAQRIVPYNQSSQHFVTVTATGIDRVPEFKNLVALTVVHGSAVSLFALDHDSRRWGHPNNSPSPIMGFDSPEQ